MIKRLIKVFFVAVVNGIILALDGFWFGYFIHE